MFISDYLLVLIKLLLFFVAIDIFCPINIHVKQDSHALPLLTYEHFHRNVADAVWFKFLHLYNTPVKTPSLGKKTNGLWHLHM